MGISAAPDHDVANRHVRSSPRHSDGTASHSTKLPTARQGQVVREQQTFAGPPLVATEFGGLTTKRGMKMEEEIYSPDCRCQDLNLRADNNQ
jgi:hypothetical protein